MDRMIDVASELIKGAFRVRLAQPQWLTSSGIRGALIKVNARNGHGIVESASPEAERILV